jgi:transposase
MISMPTINSIRQLWRQGDSVFDIARKTGVSRDTVYKYRDLDDLSPKIPVKTQRRSKLDPYKCVIDTWLEQDMKNCRKQRHTAKRIHERLITEYDADVSITTVERYVKTARKRFSKDRNQYLDLAWAPGEAQADFGETDFYLQGVRTRLSYFVLTFPFSNVGFAQLFPGENAECVCQALRNIFEYVGGVPTKIVFDNAAGVGRRVYDTIKTTELFEAASAHYGFSYRFCNPYSGNEKGNVENKVGTIRRNLFVPIPQIWNIDTWNAKLLDNCMKMADKPHWIKGEMESQLFIEDRFALYGLPEKPFECIRYITRSADKYGKVRVDGKHFYSTDPALGGRMLTIGLGAFDVKIFDEHGTFICTHRRAYGKAPTDTTDPASQLGLLSVNIRGWENSKVRCALPDDLRKHMDSLEKEELRREVRLMRDQASMSGWDATIQAMQAAYLATGRVDCASVSVSAARIQSGTITYEEPIDLSVYDQAMGAL